MTHTAVFYATHSFFRRMKTIEIFFSPTGGTRKVCDALTRAIDNGEPTVIDMAKPEWTNSVQHIVPTDCLAVIAAPSFAGRVPSTMAARMAQVRAEGGKAVIVCVYGNRAYDDTLVELQDLAEQSGFTVVAAVAAIAEHSVVRQYATGRPDSDDMAMLTNFANKIKLKLSSGEYSVPQIPGYTVLLWTIQTSSVLRFWITSRQMPYSRPILQLSFLPLLTATTFLQLSFLYMGRAGPLF